MKKLLVTLTIALTIGMIGFNSNQVNAEGESTFHSKITATVGGSDDSDAGEDDKSGDSNTSKDDESRKNEKTRDDDSNVNYIETDIVENPKYTALGLGLLALVTGYLFGNHKKRESI